MSQKAKSLTIITLSLLLSLALSRSKGNCTEGKTLIYDEEAKKLTCLQCTEGCEQCRILSDKSQICDRCRFSMDQNWFKSGENSCTRCTAGCNHCTGPGPENCNQLAVGYFYDKSTNSINKCPQGCSLCDSDGDCFSCLRGFNQLPKKQKKFTAKVVQCMPCKTDHCSGCRTVFRKRGYHGNQIFGFEKCWNCEEGYALARNGTCKKCPENCQSCLNNRPGCFKCKPGYVIDQVMRRERYRRGGGTCIKADLTDKNCEVFDHQKKECSLCVHGFYLNLDHTGRVVKGAACKPCSDLSPQCFRCGNARFRKMRIARGENNQRGMQPQNHKFTPRCYRCATGWEVNQQTQQCEKLPDRCTYAVKGACRYCVSGYVVENGKCVKPRVENCIWSPNSPDKCSRCSDRFYLDKLSGKCLKCHSSCFRCRGPSEEDCSDCPITKFTKTKGDPQHMAYPSKASSKAHRTALPLPAIQPHSPRRYFRPNVKCVDSCRSNDGNLMRPNPVTKVCEKVNAKIPYHFNENLYPVYMNGKRMMILDINGFRKKVFRYVLEDIKISELIQKEAKTDFSKTCCYRGRVKERLSAEKETFLECKCQPDYYGSKCQYNYRLYLTINLFIAKVLKVVRKLEKLKFSKISIFYFSSFFSSKKDSREKISSSKSSRS